MATKAGPQLVHETARLRAALRCPACKGELQTQDNAFRCPACSEVYPVEAGVPVLLTSDRRQALKEVRAQGHLGGGWGGNAVLQRLDAVSPLLGRVARAVYPPPPTINVVPSSEYRTIAAALCPQSEAGPIINVGSGRGTGSGRRLWRYLPPEAAVVDVDLAAFSGVDVVADGASLPLAAEGVHAVVLQAVLEHVPDPHALVAEAFRVLHAGGYLYVEVPFLQGFHADPSDYQRFTLEGLRHLLRQFEIVRSGVSIGPVSSLCWLVRELACLPFPDGFSRLATRYAVSWLVAPWRYLDWLAVRTPYAQRVACEVYILARKRG